MYQSIYMEINIICVAILAFIFTKIRGSDDRRSSNLELMKLIISLTIILVCDMIWVHVDGRNGLNVTLNYIASAGYLGFSGFVGYFALSYVENMLNLKTKKDYFITTLYLVPAVFLLVISFLSIPYSYMFQINESNHYERGLLYFLQPAIPSFYAFVATFKIILHYCKTKNYQAKKEMRSMMSFFFLPIVGALFGIVFVRIPVTWPLAVLSVLLVYSNFQSYLILTDSLTGLNNRKRFDDYLSQQIAMDHNVGHLALLLADIDSFKKINDVYGHYEGDNTLVEVGHVLTSVCNGAHAFVARYGGDEFAIVFKYDDVKEVEIFRQKIYDAVIKSAENSNRKYNLELSIGIEYFDTENAIDIRSLISGADNDMYKEKKRRKLAKTTKYSK